jgi:hypothetical protein
MISPRASEIANIPEPNPAYYSTPGGIKQFVNFVRESQDPMIAGLVSMMAEEIQHHRQDGLDYMGGTSTEMPACIADSKVLLARVLLERSSHGNPPGYVRPQLDNIAWYIATEENGTDSFHNWLKAERRYVRQGLEYLAELQQWVTKKVA